MGISIARTFGRQITRRLQPTAKTSCRNSPLSVEMTAIFYSGRAWAVVGRSARGEGGRGEGRGGRFPCQDSRRFPSCGALPARARGAGRARPTPVKVTLVAGILPPRLYAASLPGRWASQQKRITRSPKGVQGHGKPAAKEGRPRLGSPRPELMVWSRAPVASQASRVPIAVGGPRGSRPSAGGEGSAEEVHLTTRSPVLS